MQTILTKEILRNNVEECLINTYQFIQKYLPLANGHNTDFIVDDLWTSLIPEQIRNDLLNIADDIPIQKYCSNAYSANYPSLVSFYKEVESHSLEGLPGKVVTDLSLFESSIIENHVNNERSEVQNTHMSPKKHHEVSTMSRLCSRLALHHSIDQTLDIGSGRGYLGAHISLKYNMVVVGVDSQPINTSSAKLRSSKLAFQWKAKDKVNISNKEKVLKEDDSVEENVDLNQDLLSLKMDESQHAKDSIKENKVIQRSSVPKRRKNLGTKAQQIIKERMQTAHLYTANTVLVEPGMDLSYFSNGDDAKKNVMITGLHTCGSLSPTSLRMFCFEGDLSSPRATVLCNVGCCYHLLEEEFATHAYDKNDVKSFPMSEVLMKRRAKLGRNARLLACQALPRLEAKEQLPDHSIYWRAELQAILCEATGDKSSEWNIGKLAKKHEHFDDYVNAAMKKLNIVDNVTDRDYSSRLSDSANHRMNSFFQLRALLASVIECLIILDRYHFLLSQDNVKEAHLIKLFDAVISPRCYALVAVKNVV